MYMTLVEHFWTIVFTTLTLATGTSSEQVYILETPECRTCTWSWDTSAHVSIPDVLEWHHPSGQYSLNKYSVCSNTVNDSEVRQPNNWLRSGIIRVGSIERLDVTIRYYTKECPSPPNSKVCKESFYAYVWESNNTGPIPCPINNSSLYRRFANISRLSGNIETLTMPLMVNSKYIVLGFRDRGGCRTLYSVKVSYKACHEETLEDSLVSLPQTLSQLESIPVQGRCTTNAERTVPGSLMVPCDSNGEWNISRLEGKCVCIKGMENNGGRCEACRSGAFNEGNGFNCIEIPSAPRNVMVMFVNQSAVRLAWQPPEITGDHGHVSYDVECRRRSCNGDDVKKCFEKACDSGVSYIPNKQGLNKAQVMIVHLSLFVNYTLRIYARNRVSGVARETHGLEGNFALITVKTNGSRPGKPEVSVQRLDEEDAVLVSWSLEDTNGIILNYHVTYIKEDDLVERRSVNTTQMSQRFEGLKPGKTYEFQVYAVNSHGKGPTGMAKFTLLKGGFADELLVPIASGGAGGLLLLVLVLIVMAVFILRRRKSNVQKDYIRSVERGEEMTQRRYIDPSNHTNLIELLSTFTSEVERSKIKLEEMIGQGEFADVYRGTVKHQGKKEVVAFKVLRPGSSEKNQQDLLSEASILAQFGHPNVIRLIGVITKSRPMMILTEFMEQGSLESFLEKRKDMLTNLQLTGMARGVACGMLYLSEMNFIHRDLAARNVLVGENMSCKVSDFGLSRELADDNPDSEYETQGGKIAVRWTAPEALNSKTFSSASDVWSYGILLWEIMSFGERPYWDWNNIDVVCRVTSGYRLPPPKGCPKIIHNLMLDCWESDKTKRPTFAEIVDRLSEIIRSSESLNAAASSPSQTPFMRSEIVRPESVKEWLISISMGQYLDLFTAAKIDSLQKVDTLEDKDLREIGVSLIGHRNKMKKSIKSWTTQSFINHGMEDHE